MASNDSKQWKTRQTEILRIIKSGETFGLGPNYCLGWINKVFQQVGYSGFNQDMAVNAKSAIISSPDVYPGMVIISDNGYGDMAYCGHIAIYGGINSSNKPQIYGLEGGAVNIKDWDTWASVYSGPYTAGFPKEWGTTYLDCIKDSAILGLSDAKMKVAAQVRAELKTLGYRDIAIAGILGNCYQESTFNTTAQGAAYGLFQFEIGTGSANDYAVYANTQGLPKSSVKCQVDFMNKKLSSTFTTYNHGSYTYPSTGETVWLGGTDWEGMTLSDFKNLGTKLTKYSASAGDAAEIFCKVYERPSIAKMDTRRNAAAAFYSHYRKGAV